jgi:hypothetical protein
VSIDALSPRSRRAMLGAVLGAGAATVASALRPLSARAADGQPVLLGVVNSAATFTQITNSDHPGTYALLAADGTYALAGVNDTSEPAVVGQAHGSDGIGVKGHVYDATQTGGAVGVLGATAGHHTQIGVSGVAVPEGIAVNARTEDGFGVFAEATGGYAVQGGATTGRGVFGQATSGLGVYGAATTGTGLLGSATSGFALLTTGRIRLDQSAGKATIASGASSVVVAPGIDLTASSAVIATLNSNAGGSTAVKRVTVNTTTNTFTIYLTANSTASVRVAWLVLS